MCDKRAVVESTLRAMSLDHTRLPLKRNPDYRHTAPADAEAAAKANADSMRAIMSGEMPPQLKANQPQLRSQQPSQSSGMPPQQATASGPTRTGHAANDQQELLPPERILKISPTPAHMEYRRSIPAVGRQPEMRSWPWSTIRKDSAWLIGMCGTSSLEMGQDLFKQHYSYIKPPIPELVEAVCNVEDSYPFDPENGIVRFITPEMLKNPRYQPSATPPPTPNDASIWTSPDCQDLPGYARWGFSIPRMA